MPFDCYAYIMGCAFGDKSTVAEPTIFPFSGRSDGIDTACCYGAGGEESDSSSSVAVSNELDDARLSNGGVDSSGASPPNFGVVFPDGAGADLSDGVLGELWSPPRTLYMDKPVALVSSTAGVAVEEGANGGPVYCAGGS